MADAAMRGDRAALKALVTQGVDVNVAQGDGMTALHWAALRGDVDAIRMLAAAGARVDAATRNGNYLPLHLAARNGRTTAISALLGVGADAKAGTSAGGATALHFAASEGTVEAVRVLLDAGVPVDVRDGAWSQTPLMWAAAAGRTDAAKLLLARGADVKATSKVEDIPARERADRVANAIRQRKLVAAKQAEQQVLAQAAAGAGGVPAVPGAGGAVTGQGGGGVTAAMPGAAAAATPGAPGTARGAGASTATDGARAADATPAAAPRGERASASSATPRAPGQDAVTRNDSVRAERALSYGELVGNKGGLAPLHFAVRQGHRETAEALLAAGADINQVTVGDKSSALLLAAINGQFDVAMALLAKGADPKLASVAGATPLYSAINVQWAPKSLYPQPTAQRQQQTGYLTLMEALLKAGADVNARLTKHLWYMSYNFDLLGVNTQGATPFWRAAYALDVPAMKLLKQYGADHMIPTTKPSGQMRNDDASPDDAAAGKSDPSGLAPIPAGGPGVFPLHAASGVGYGEGFAANSHIHAPDAWMPAVKYLLEELKVDPNQRDHNGYNAIHHAAARGDNELIQYLMSKGVDVMAVSRRGQTTADMANGPVQRIPPFVSTVELLEKLGAKNNHKCKSC
ncbi:MAG: ankyrin repeat domain-containing protein [Gemmatimonadaceae bacterium]|nr:ankyrin repeat domain-containing protein [Gemmatimonadaceae bacterium]